jgi:hypothetical protein
MKDGERERIEEREKEIGREKRERIEERKRKKEVD